MPRIYVGMLIHAPIERVFDLARSIDLHKQSAKESGEEAIAGRTSGLIGLGETATWRAKHFGRYHEMTVRVTQFKQPYFFADVMEKGPFAKWEHTHQFETLGKNYTITTDIIEYTSPFGALGRMADSLFLKRYLKRFMLRKVKELKRVAEGDEWKQFLPGEK